MVRMRNLSMAYYYNSRAFVCARLLVVITFVYISYIACLSAYYVSIMFFWCIYLIILLLHACLLIMFIMF